jgi:putative ABC transport system permease protein
MLKATLKSIRSRVGRIFSTAFAVILGISFLAGTLIFTDSIGRAFDEIFATAFEGTDAVVRSNDVIVAGFGFELRAPVEESLLETVRAVDGVEVAEGFVQGTATIVGADGEPVRNSGQGPPTFGGSWIDDDEINQFTIVDGRPPTGRGEVAIDETSAATGNLSIGDQVTVLTPSGSRPFELVAIVRFGTSGVTGGATFAIWEQDEAQRVLGSTGRFAVISVRAVEGVSQEELASRIAAAVPAGNEVVTGAVATAEAQSQIRENLRFLNIFLTVFALVAVFVSVFVILNTFSIVVAQRSREIGLFRAIGASRAQLLWSIVIEAFVTGIVGSVVGLVAGIGLAFGLQAVLSLFGVDLPTSGTVIRARTAAASMVLGTVVTVVAALLPALDAARVSPMEALRESAVEPWTRNRIRFATGLVILAGGGGSIFVGLLRPSVLLAGVGVAAMFIGVFVLGPSIARQVAAVIGWPYRVLFGPTGRLAQENAMRNPARTARTAAALTIGVALITAISIMSSSLGATVDNTVRTQFVGDVILDSGAFGPESGFSPELTAEVAELAEVDQITGLRVGVMNLMGVSDFVLAVDPEAAEEIIDLGVVAGDPATVTSEQIMMLDSWAEELNLELGDAFLADFVGAEPRLLEVAVLYENQEFMGRQVLSLDLFDQFETQRLDFNAYLTVADGFTVEQARAAIEPLADDYPNVSVLDVEQYAETQTAPFDQLLGLLTGLLLLAILIAAFGIANTLWLSVIERTREIGLLRAVGASQNQIGRSVGMEAAITSTFGSLLGVLLGLFFGYAMVTAVREEFAVLLDVPAGRLVLVVIVGAIIGLLAAAVPAYRAGRLNILAAIGTE